MNRYRIDAFYQDPGLRRRLFENARRERARALKAALAWLWKKAGNLVPHRHGRPARWLARLG